MCRVLAARCLLAAVAIAAFLSAECHAADGYPYNFDQQYLNAVQDAQNVTTNKLVGDLRTIGAPYKQGQFWKTDAAGDQILMCMFTDFTGYDRNYDRTASQAAYHPDLWISVAPDLWQFHQTHHTTGDQMALRTKQLLGMPTGHAGNRVVEFWVKPNDLFRPATNSNITEQVTSVTPSPSDPHLAWFNATKSTIYNELSPYPWTQLGYTYDWGPDARANNEGLTEFLCARHFAGSTDGLIAVYAVISIGSYGYYDRATSNFNVTGGCDTIWAGDRYLPGGSQIVIGPDGIVYEGITVSSAGWTINNSGIIQGPGLNLDNSWRDSVLEFQHGGTLVNSGAIGGFRVGVYAGGTETTTIANSGLISGTQYSIQSSQTDTANVAITNSGTLTGDVFLGNGNNTITNRGKISGSVTTGAGDDTVSLLGGSITGSIDAGSGVNTLIVNPGAGGSVSVGHDILGFQPFTVQSGTARFDGEVDTSVTVAQGATLGGWATITGNLTNNGRIAQTNSPGVMDVGGNYSQTAGSTMVLRIQKPAAGMIESDFFRVTGNATFASQSTIEVDHISGSRSVIQGNDRFTFLRTTTGLVTDNGATIDCDSDFIQFYRDPNDKQSFAGNNHTFTLIAQRTAYFRSAAITDNQLALARSLDSDGYTATGDYAVMINDMLFMTQPQFLQSIAGLNPSPYFAVAAASNRTTQYLAESTADYLRTRRNRGDISFVTETAFCPSVRSIDGTNVVRLPSTGDSDFELADLRTASGCKRFGYADPFGIFYGENSTDDRVGFQANSAGSRFGVDQQFSDCVIVGIGGAYVNSQLLLNDQVGNGRMDSYMFGPYMTYYGERWYVDSVVSVGFNNNVMHRSVTTGSFAGREDADFSATNASAYFGIGQDVLLDRYTVSPTASLQYIYYRGAEFTETGLAGPALTVLPQDSNSLRSKLGARLMRSVALGSVTVVPEVNCGWAHEYLANDDLNARFALGIASFATDPGGIYRDAGYFGCSATLARSPRAMLIARYQGELSSGGVFNACDLGLALGF